MAQEKEKKICDNCALAEWDMKFPNLDFQKRPTLLRCPHYEYAIIRGTLACKHYKEKQVQDN